MAACQCGSCRRCQCRRAQAKYQRTAKGKAVVARYNHSPRRRVVTARYRSSPRGQKVDAAHNARRIFIGANYHSTAQTIEDAAVINSHVKEKLREFKQRFADGKEIESVHAGEVPTEAAV